MLFPAAYVMMVIPQWVELPTARQAGEKTAKICRLDSIREPHEFVGGPGSRLSRPIHEANRSRLPLLDRDYAESPAMPKLKRDRGPCPCRARRGVVNGRGAVGAGVAYLKLRELASTIKLHTIQIFRLRPPACGQ
jgi:hypothetical protein